MAMCGRQQRQQKQSKENDSSSTLPPRTSASRTLRYQQLCAMYYEQSQFLGLRIGILRRDTAPEGGREGGNE